VLTVHTVVSRFNQHRFREINDGLQFLQPIHISRGGGKSGWNWTRSAWASRRSGCLRAHRRFPERAGAAAPAKGIAKFTQAFRAQYYQLAKRVLYERTQVIACYAGWASMHIAPNGDIWSCCIRAGAGRQPAADGL